MNRVTESTTSGAVRAVLAIVLTSICTEIGSASDSALIPMPYTMASQVEVALRSDNNGKQLQDFLDGQVLG